MLLTDINIRDPFVLLHNDIYYMYGSRVAVQNGFDVYKSTDLENWSEAKSVFELPKDFWGTKDCWAPEVHYYNGRFYMLASFKAENLHRGTAILVSDTPDGLFTVHAERITPPEWECLDGTFYVQDGQPYMVFCHEWVQVKNGEVWAVPLSKDLKTAIAEPTFLWRAGDASWVAPVRGDDHFVTDGPYLFKTESGQLKSLWSSFIPGHYVLATATSESGSVLGPWHIDEDLLYDSNGGHGMIFKTKEGKRMIAIHSPNLDLQERPVFLPF